MNPSAHFFHIQFFKEKLNFEIQISFWPDKKLLPFAPTYFLPSELLTYEENVSLGLTENKNHIDGDILDSKTMPLKYLWKKFLHLALDIWFRLRGFSKDAEI